MKCDYTVHLIYTRLRKIQYLKDLYRCYFTHLDSGDLDGRCVATANILDRKHSFSLLHSLKIKFIACVCVSCTLNIVELLLHFLCSSLSKNTL
jgi:hypothetical protein